jgi:leucyl-tRNA synthetase
MHRFLARLWRLTDETAQRTSAAAAGGHGDAPAAAASAPAGGEGDSPDVDLLRKTHWAIDKVSGDLRRFAFNTAIAAVMELCNECSRLREQVSVATLGTALASAGSLLSPFAPHLGAEIYERLTGERVWEAPWPQADPALLERDVYELVCQVNGKLRDRVSASTGASAEELKALCRSAANVQAHVQGKEIVKEIVVPGKLVNLVVR